MFKELTNEEKQEQARLRNMDITDIAKAVRKDLKKEFGKTMKFSVRTKRFTGGQELTVTIKKANESYFKTLKEFEQEHLFEKLDNPSLYESLLTRFKRHDYNALKDEVVKKVNEIANNYNFDNSVSQIDYFDNNYYCFVGGDRIEVLEG